MSISRINRSHDENERNVIDRKRDGIPCLIIFPCCVEDIILILNGMIRSWTGLMSYLILNKKAFIMELME